MEEAHESIVALETRMWVRTWIWFWYNDLTRMAVVLGIPAGLITLAAALCEVSGEALRSTALWSYGGLFAWMFVDNDYSKLRRIGLDEERRPLHTKIRQ